MLEYNCIRCKRLVIDPKHFEVPDSKMCPECVREMGFETVTQLVAGYKKEAVDHPSHYNSGNIECIDYVEDCGFGEGFNLGNAIKYIARANHKNNKLEDLRKAAWYLSREIERISKDEVN